MAERVGQSLLREKMTLQKVWERLQGEGEGIGGKTSWKAKITHQEKESKKKEPKSRRTKEKTHETGVGERGLQWSIAERFKRVRKKIPWQG